MCGSAFFPTSVKVACNCIILESTREGLVSGLMLTIEPVDFFNLQDFMLHTEQQSGSPKTSHEYVNYLQGKYEQVTAFMALIKLIN